MTTMYPPIKAREAASDSVGTWWAAMHRFAEERGYQPEITHLEVNQEDYESDNWRYKNRSNQKIIKSVVICGCFCTAEEKSLSAIYQEFYDWLQPLYEHCKLAIQKGIVVYLGFNYDKPGLIVASEAGLWYDKQRDLLDIPTTGPLYETMEFRESGEALEDKAWDEFMTKYDE